MARAADRVAWFRQPGLLAALPVMLFLLVGLLLWSYYDGASIEALGLRRTDEVFFERLAHDPLQRLVFVDVACGVRAQEFSEFVTHRTPSSRGETPLHRSR